MAAVWQEFRANDGRPYWYNSQTKQSVWEKPDELKTPLETALGELGWKAYESNGKPYYVHGESKQTTWDIPPEVKAKADAAAATIAATQATASPVPAGPAAGSGGPSTPVLPSHSSLPARPSDANNMQLAAPGQFAAGGPSANLPNGPAAMQQQQQEYINYEAMSREEAEKAFFDLLKKHNVTASWTWEQVLRETVTDPAFRALRTLGERKQAFEAYREDILRKERENKEKSMDRNRPAWRMALGRLSEGDYAMKSWWSWERASREIRSQMPDVWHMSRTDEERENLWREYMGELTRKEEARAQEMRTSNIEKLTTVLKSLELDFNFTRFQEVDRAVKNTKEWREDVELQGIEPLDFLIVYEESVKKAEQEAHTLRQKQKTERQRRIRKNREAYVAYLSELKEQGTIKAGTKWKEIYPVIKDDERFTEMLANPGSTPLELFWDVVDEMDLKIEEDSRVIENVMSEKGFAVTAQTTFAEFDEKVRDDTRVSDKIDEEARKLVHRSLLDRIAFRAREEERRQERRLRHLAEDFRYALRKLDPPLNINASYEGSLARIKDIPEFIELKDENDDLRKSSFDKFIARQKEKAAELEKDKAKEREREKDRNGYHSDADSLASGPRRTRHISTKPASSSIAPPDRPRSERTPLKESAIASPASPPRSRASAIPTSPRGGRDKARDASRDRSEEPGRYSDRRRDRDRPRDSERDRRREDDRDRDSKSSRSHRDGGRSRERTRDKAALDSDEDRGSSRRKSRRHEEDYAADGSRERSSKRDKEREKERGRDRDEVRSSSARKREDDSRDKESLRDSKRAKYAEDNGDKEEGEI